MKKPRVSTGAFTGALLMAPLIAGFYLAWQLFRLPFVPFSVFDWLSRSLPGRIITFAIESMVRMIRWLNLGRTDVAAKTAEQILSVIIILVAGMIAAGVLFAVLRWSAKSALSLGGALGMILGVAVVVVNQRPDQAAPNPILGASWTLAMFFTWGITQGWIYCRLAGKSRAGTGGSDWLERLDRRKFLLRLGGATAAITVVGAALGALIGKHHEEPEAGEVWSTTHALPNAGALILPVPGTRPEFTPLAQHYRIDINSIPPEINEKNWRLSFSGLLEQPKEMTLEQLRSYEPMHQFITLECISNPVAGDLISTTRWTGASMQQILPDLSLRAEATHLKIRSLDGFFETVALETIKRDERVMLCYAWDGVPLEAAHGFPLRIYIPDVYGMKQPKWIESIEATDHLEPGYWVVRSWSKQAQMKSTSVIDTIAVNQKTRDATGQILVPIGGIAFAGARSISKVELQLDQGEWRAAQLRAPLSDTTWVIWRYEMPFQAGEHTLTVRCYDDKGKMQIVTASPSYPDGATGLHSKGTML